MILLLFIQTFILSVAVIMLGLRLEKLERWQEQAISTSYRIG